MRSEMVDAVVNAQRGSHIQSEVHNRGWADRCHQRVEHLQQEGFGSSGQRSKAAEGGQYLDGRCGWRTDGDEGKRDLLGADAKSYCDLAPRARQGAGSRRNGQGNRASWTGMDELVKGNAGGEVEDAADGRSGGELQLDRVRVGVSFDKLIHQ